MTDRMPGPPATEDGLLETEAWEEVQPGPGHGPLSPRAQVEWDRDSGEVRRKHEEFIVTAREPERPAP